MLRLNMKIIISVLLLISSAINLNAEENLLECKYTISHWFGTAEHDYRPVEQDDNLPNETLNINTDEKTISFGVSKYDYFLHNDIIWIDFPGSNNTTKEISLNAINGDMVVNRYAKVGEPSRYEYVDSDGLAVTHKFFYRCSKTERLIN